MVGTNTKIEGKWPHYKQGNNMHNLTPNEIEAWRRASQIASNFSVPRNLPQPNEFDHIYSCILDLEERYVEDAKNAYYKISSTPEPRDHEMEMKEWNAWILAENEPK